MIFSPTTELNVWTRRVQYKANRNEPQLYKNTDIEETYLCVNHEVKYSQIQCQGHFKTKISRYNRVEQFFPK